MTAAAPTHCVWCGSALGRGATRLRGRPAARTAARRPPTPGPPTRCSPEPTASWYRPESGRRFALVGDALLRRTRGHCWRVGSTRSRRPGRCSTSAPATARCVDALRAADAMRSALERMRAAPTTSATSRSTEVEGEWAAIVFWHSLEHLPEPGDAIRAGRAPAAARRRARDRRPEREQPPGAGVRRPLAASRPAAPPGPPPGGALARRLERSGFAGRARLARARRPGRDRVARRPRRLAARRPATSTRHCAARTRAARRSRRGIARFALAAGAAARAGRAGAARALEVVLRRGGHRVRGGAPCLSRQRGRRRDAGAPGGGDAASRPSRRSRRTRSTR